MLFDANAPKQKIINGKLTYMNIIWFTWKDLKHPLAGGAEVVNDELAKRLVADGHQINFIVAGFKGSVAEETYNGYRIIRLGNRWTVYYKAWQYYRKNTLHKWVDFVIEEINTIPFFTNFYVKQPNLLIIHQLCRQIWFYQMRFPLSLVGYLVEPFCVWLLRKSRVVTISNSSKEDLLRYGFQQQNIKIIPLGLDTPPVDSLASIDKYTEPTLLSLGAIRPMKRTAHQISAFEIAKLSIPNLKLKIAGDATGAYARQVLQQISNSPYKDSIEYLGRVSQADKQDLMQHCHAILVTSVKEGWGLIVTEAASQGTPAVVYNVDGLRDSVRHGQTGLVCQYNTPINMADNIVILLNDRKRYTKIRARAWQWSKEATFDLSYQKFKDYTGILNEKSHPLYHKNRSKILL